MPRVMAIFAWFSLGVAGTFYDRAHPHGYGLDVLFGVRRSLSVNTGDLAVSHGMVWVTLCLCAIGLAFNSRRMRRSGDRYNRSLLWLAFGCSAGLFWRALAG